jgi:hypothetical protein
LNINNKIAREISINKEIINVKIEEIDVLNGDIINKYNPIKNVRKKII